MTAARELVTTIRYELERSGLAKSNQVMDQLRGKAAAAGAAVEKTGQAADRAGNSFGRLGGIVRGLVAGFSILSAARIADEWAGVEGRVGLVTNGVEEQKAALDGLYALSQRTRQSYAGTAGVFQGIARNGKELGLELEQQLKLTETIGAAMTIGGGSAQSQQAALMQLSQALGTGTLRGEELNSIMEQAPRLAQAIAVAFNVPVGQLKKLGEQGKLSSKVLAEGLLKQSEALSAEFQRMPLTFSGAMTRLSNSLGRQIDKFNKSSGAARVFYNVTSLVVDNLDTILKYVMWIGAAAGLTKLAYVARSIATSGALLTRVLARFGGAAAFGALIGTFIRMLAVATAIYYVFDDIATWLAGGPSLLGDVIGPLTQWKWLTDGIAEGLTWIKDALGGSAETLTQWVSKWGLLAVIVGGFVALVGMIPALVIGAGLLIVWAIGLIRQNWDQAVGEMRAIWDGLVSGIVGAWDTILAKARAVWAQIGQIIASAVPDWARNGFNAVSNAVSGAVNNMGGGAAFGITPTMMPNRSGTGGTTVVTNAPNVTVHATSSEPAAVAAAAARGTSRGMGSALVPNVEASR